MTVEMPARPASQAPLFPIEFEFGPAALHLVITPRRLPRARCRGCGQRRVLFAFGVGDQYLSPPVCRQCMWAKR